MRILTKVACGSVVLCSAAGGAFALGAAASNPTPQVAAPVVVPPIATAVAPAPVLTPPPTPSSVTPPAVAPPPPVAAPAPAAQSAPSVPIQTSPAPAAPTVVPSSTVAPPAPAPPPPPTPAPAPVTAPTTPAPAPSPPISGTLQVPGSTQITDCTVTYVELQMQPDGQVTSVRSTSGGDCAEMQAIANEHPGAILTQQTYTENSQAAASSSAPSGSTSTGAHQSF